MQETVICCQDQYGTPASGACSFFSASRRLERMLGRQKVHQKSPDCVIQCVDTAHCPLETQFFILFLVDSISRLVPPLVLQNVLSRLSSRCYLPLHPRFTSQNCSKQSPRHGLSKCSDQSFKNIFQRQNAASSQLFLSARFMAKPPGECVASLFLRS